MNAYTNNEQRSPRRAGTRIEAASRAATEPAHDRKHALGSASAALRSSRRVRLVAALALIAVCGIAVPVLALRMTPKPAEVLAAAVDLPPGSVITSADLTTVDASGPSSAMVPAADQRSILGQSVRVEIPAGALLNDADLGSFPPVGSTVVPVAVKPGQYPANLQTGETVAVFPISTGTTATQAIAQHAAASGTVTQISPVSGDGSSEVVIDLEVATGAAAAVAQAQTVVLVSLDERGDVP